MNIVGIIITVVLVAIFLWLGITTVIDVIAFVKRRKKKKDNNNNKE